MINYKASITIHGATVKPIYGKNLDLVLERAVESLTRHRPGWAGLTPHKIVVESHSRNEFHKWSRWEPVREIFYADLSEEQHEWRKRLKLPDTEF